MAKYNLRICECDNTHEANDTVCRGCWSTGMRFERDGFYVKQTSDGYAVFVPGLTHATSTCAYPLTPDGLSLAVADCKYRARSASEKVKA